VGVVVSFLRDRRLFLLLLLSFLVSVLFAVNYDISDIEVFYISSFLIAAIWMGYALQWVLSMVQRIRRRRGKGAGEQESRGADDCGSRIVDCGVRGTGVSIRNPKSEIRNPSAPLFFCCLTRWILVLLPLLPLISHFHRSDRSRNEIAHRYGEDILRGLEPNAVLLTQGDDASFVLLYLASGILSNQDGRAAVVGGYRGV